MPGFVEPYLATLADQPPSGAGWLHEIKFDGYRLQCEIDRGRVTLRTRRGLDWTEKFRGLAEELAKLPVESALIDGEALVEDSAGISDFSGLQAALSEGRADSIVFYAFDLLHINGYDLRGVPLRERKAVLAELMSPYGDKGRLRFSSDFETGGDRLLQHVCRLGAEGIVSKRADEPYRSGRAKGWLKAKCADRQEFVIAGYVPSTTSPKAIGSLVAAYYENGKLRHAGRVGTGYSNKVAQELFKLLDPERVQKPPFPDPLPAEARRDARFVEPKRVMEVAFRGWTGGGQIRQAAFKGLREDKPPQEVVRESTGRVSDPKPAQQRAATIKLTHPDRVLWPEAGITKQGLADYYASMWEWIEPHIVKRPLSLVRCPTGIAQRCFFQKHEWQGMDRNIELIRDPKDGEKLVSVSSLEGLLALVQASALEIHPWGSTGDDLDHPDRLIFDLDPGEGVAFADMIAGAHEIRDRLAAMKLESFVKTSGGKGLHVVLPLKPSAGWDEAKDFCRHVAESMERDAPQRYTATVAKKERKGKIYVDYLRNGRGATAIAPYSSRARAIPGVATPLAWEELASLNAADAYTLDNIENRMAHLRADPWAEMSKIKQTLPKAKVAQAKAAQAKVRKPSRRHRARLRRASECVLEPIRQILRRSCRRRRQRRALRRDQRAPGRRFRAGARRRAEILSRRQYAPHPQHALRARCRDRNAERPLLGRGVLRRSPARHAGAYRRRPRPLHDQPIERDFGMDPGAGRALPALARRHAQPRAHQLVLSRRRPLDAERALSDRGKARRRYPLRRGSRSTSKSKTACSSQPASRTARRRNRFARARWLPRPAASRPISNG